MKKNDWILGSVTALYSFLFYKEGIGVNLTIFTLVLLITSIIKNRYLIKRKNWILVAFGTLCSSMAVVVYGNSLSIFANVLSLIVLTGISFNKNSSIFISFLNGIYTWVSSPVFFIHENRKQQNSQLFFQKNKRKFIIFLFPIIVVLVFFFMYRSANPIFKSLTDNINLDWISFGWIFFTLLGMLFLYGFFNVKNMEELSQFDEKKSLDILNNSENESIFFGKKLNISDEFLSGKVLFILLNVLIFVVNFGDFNFIFFSKTLPENITFATFLHQGVGMLIVSILISIAIILFYFRGQMNFYSKSKTFKILAYIWILQNMFLLISVCFKNNLYIESYGLTYKRIGIYIYIALTLLGLISTTLKIYLIKNNLYMFRFNGWSFFTVLIFCSLLNWDQIIVDHNISINYENNSKLDFYYLLSLSETTIPTLRDYEKKINSPVKKEIFREIINVKLANFEQVQLNKSWKTWNYRDFKTMNLLANSNLNN